MGLKVKVKQNEVEKDINDRLSDLGISFELPEDVMENITMYDVSSNKQQIYSHPQ